MNATEYGYTIVANFGLSAEAVREAERPNVKSLVKQDGQFLLGEIEVKKLPQKILDGIESLDGDVWAIHWRAGNWGAYKAWLDGDT